MVMMVFSLEYELLIMFILNHMIYHFLNIDLHFNLRLVEKANFYG